MQPPSDKGHQHQAGEGTQPKRKRGRPRKSHAEREAEKERRIPLSFEGRMKFRPGDPHALDTEFREARNLRALIVEEIAQINGQITALVEQDDPGAEVSQEENALKAFLWQEYCEHKHRDHIIAVFLGMRRRRLQSRLEAAHTALEIAAELLTPDDTILKELRRALHKREPTGELPEGKGEQDSGEEEAQQEPGDDRPPQITAKHIFGNAPALRQQLAQFDERVKLIRGTISEGIGWFEEFYVEKWRANPEAIAYIARREEVPEDVPLSIPYLCGPYLKYRWRESGYGPIYTISMGRIPDDELAAAEQWASITQQDDGEPWPDV